MKIVTYKNRTVLLILALMTFVPQVQGQFLKKLGKAAERAAERTVERRVESETEEKTDQALDTIFEGGSGQTDERESPVPEDDSVQSTNSENDSSGSSSDDSGSASTGSGSDESGDESDVNSKSNRTIVRAPDFEPGVVPILQDDFKKDGQGDFPAQWDTNGSGEIVLVDGSKWLRLSGNSTYVPLTKEALPDNYTVEFDLLTQGLDSKTSSQAFITLILEDTPLFQRPSNFAMVELSPCQFISSRGVVEKVVNGKRQIRNEIGKDYRQIIDGKSRISIAVNKTRMRVWMNDNKLVDIPRLIPKADLTFKIMTRGLRDDPNLDEVFITNFKMGKAGVDNRSKLISEGRLSTNAIKFESGSDALKPESYSIIREIAGVLEENPEVNIKIIGHTDSEGDEANNLSLSKTRAEAVKSSMEQQYGIASDRIITDGKGETEPVGDNASAEGMAANRRVEFIKL